MRGFARVAGVLALVVAAFVGGLQWRDRAVAPGGDAASGRAVVQSPDAVAKPEAGESSALSAGAEGVQAAREPMPAWPRLPPPGASVVAHFDELADRARRGDDNAACRLAVDLQHCRRVLGRRELAENLQDQAARRGDAPDGLIEFIADVEQQDEREGGGRCDGLQPAHLATAFDFQRQAAQARPELRTWFALDPALDRRDFVNELERWAEYRRLAMPWLEAAAREGQLGALIALARVHGDLRRNSPPYPPFRLPDDVRTVAYSDLLQRYGADYAGVEIGARQARARLDPAALARAADLTETLYRPDRPPPRDRTLRAMMSRTLEPLPEVMECEAVSRR